MFPHYRGQAALVDAPRLHRSAVLVVQACDRMEKNKGDRTAILEVRWRGTVEKSNTEYGRM